MKKYILFLIVVIALFLRFWRIGEAPISLFGDELDVGYQAYSILKTGKDYYGNFMPLHFHSLAEWRTPVYLYSAVPTVAFFGISPLGVRLPAAIFGVLGVIAFYYLVYEITKDRKHAIAASFLMAISPWQIQYSRAGFEVTQMLFFLLLAVYFFLKSFKVHKSLPISSLFFSLIPWVYSTGKFFVPLFVFFIVLNWFDDFRKIRRKYIYFSLLIILFFAIPMILISGGASQRFSYISVFTDPTLESEIGYDRSVDARSGVPPFISRVFHNKVIFWSDMIIRNILTSFSSDFLFVNGDPNLRHSVAGVGQFYKVEFLSLLFGAIAFFGSYKNIKAKRMLVIWIGLSVITSSLTRDGGNHATRLFLMLPPFLILSSWGFLTLLYKNRIFYKFLFLTLFVLLLTNFISYQHNYWLHYIYDSERWWHAGLGEAIKSLKGNEAKYEKIIITTYDEPPWVFFAGWYEYPPEKWQSNFPIENKTVLPGFGEVSFIDKFYFGSPVDLGFYEWPQIIDDKTLYLASAKEVKINLIQEPQRIPRGLHFVDVITFPSGEPAYYLFTGE